MADVFISYARPDRPGIEQLAEQLEQSGFSVWWDRQIGGGAEFARTIERELEAAGKVIVAWSEHSLDSHWVRDEADFARTQGKLIPISLDGAPPPLGFRQLHCIDFSDAASGGVGELMASLGGSTAATPAPAASPPAPRQIVKPAIVILPFANMSTDEEIEFLADGLTEDILTLFSTNKHFSVPARTSVFSYKGQSVDIRQLAETFNAHYVAEGSIRKMGSKARVTVQLIAAGTGDHLWAKKYDQTLDELMEESDSIVEKIVGSLTAQLVWAEADRSENAPPETLGPWEYCQRAATAIGRAVGSMTTIRSCFTELNRALEVAPDYPLGHALSAWCYNAAIINAMYDDDDLVDYYQRAVDHLYRARELCHDDLLTLTYIGAAENYAGMQDRADQTLSQVLARNPASAEANYLICQVYAYTGRFDEARQAIERASELAPEGGFAPLHGWYRGLIEYLAGDLETARPMIKRKALENPEYGYVQVVAALCEVQAGDDEAARRHITKAREHNPQLRPEKLQPMMLAQYDSEKGAREYAILERFWAETA